MKYDISTLEMPFLPIVSLLMIASSRKADHVSWDSYRKLRANDWAVSQGIFFFFKEIDSHWGVMQSLVKSRCPRDNMVYWGEMERKSGDSHSNPDLATDQLCLIGKLSYTWLITRGLNEVTSEVLPIPQVWRNCDFIYPMNSLLLPVFEEEE